MYIYIYINIYIYIYVIYIYTCIRHASPGANRHVNYICSVQGFIHLFKIYKTNQRFVRKVVFKF